MVKNLRGNPEWAKTLVLKILCYPEETMKYKYYMQIGIWKRNYTCVNIKLPVNVGIKRK